MKSLFFLIAIIIKLNMAYALETRSSVEFQWEQDSKAAEYQVQILSQNGEVLKEMKSSDYNFRIKMPVNKYKIRGRIKTKLGNLSPWSEETELIIPPNKIKLSAAESKGRTLTADPKTYVAKVNLHWTPSPQARKYIFKLKDSSGKIIKEQEVNSPNVDLQLNPGSYKYSVTAIAPNGIASEEVETENILEIRATTLVKPKFKKEQTPQGLPEFTFEKIETVSIQGELHYAAFLSNSETLLEKYEKFKEIKWSPSPNLKPGNYKIYFWASAKGAKNSEKVIETFEVKPKEPDLQ